MTSVFRPLVTMLAAILSGLCGSYAAEPLFEKNDVFPAGMNGIARFRIPGIVVTQKGTVLAYAEARKNNSSDWGEIEVHARRSLDGGRTWESGKKIAHSAERIEGNPTKTVGGETEQTVNNPVAIVDRETGAIEFLYCINYARCFSMRSTDDGATWSKPAEITATFEPFREKVDWKVIATGPGHGIQLTSYPSGSPTERPAPTRHQPPARYSAMTTAKHGRPATSACRTKATSAIPTKP